VFALYPQLRRWWSRALLVAYPLTITLAIVVTGNHWILDAVAGVVATCVAYLLVRALELLARATRRRRLIRVLT
jgi:membrane-associated phospholipid phosphatase